MSGPHCSPSPADRSRQRVEHAERLVLAGLQAPVKIAALCRELAISERVLRDAFYRVRGLPPYRCLQMLRLSEVRRALMSAGGQSVTVTEIATSLGLVELGRFSVEYRKMFGESPSKTLRASCAERAPDRRRPDDPRLRLPHGAGGRGVEADGCGLSQRAVKDMAQVEGEELELDHRRRPRSLTTLATTSSGLTSGFGRCGDVRCLDHRVAPIRRRPFA